MRIRRLQQLVLAELKSIHLSALSPTMNLTEDISCGAAQISHLLVEKRLQFDEQLKNCGLFNTDAFSNNGDGEIGLFSVPEHKDYEVICTEEYRESRKKSCWGFEGDLEEMKKRRTSVQTIGF